MVRLVDASQRLCALHSGETIPIHFNPFTSHSRYLYMMKKIIFIIHFVGYSIKCSGIELLIEIEFPCSFSNKEFLYINTGVLDKI